MNTLSLEQIIASGYRESGEGTRTGDTPRELAAIRTYIRHAGRIVVPNHNTDKITAINAVLAEFGLRSAEHLCIPTTAPDQTRMPAVSKALLALDITGADLVIARGRLGIPGSGSLLVIMDARGRILSAALSPPHIVHEKSVPDAVRSELKDALERIGFGRPQS
ncbi:MAG TPA: DUF3236 domain-containing protein [Methanocorpusculum sp.]|nr:DUF3236 domain-containing protein [Methanocorpusculum sp.]HJK80978.1 DUF3236 domain-containing protein [Methanocorpusculum sp.]